ncbi:hypothetical protein C0J08_08400 [Marinomonas sp. CT5]|nr:hypothetical protein C0J08_08400 [Marinomonas sp. CT5]
MLMQELIGHHEYYNDLNERVARQDEKLKKLIDSHSYAQLLMSIPGVGTLTAAQCLSDIPNVNEFKNGRHFFGKWIVALRAKKPFNVAVVALANQLVRIAWSVLKTQQAFEIRV